MPRPIAFAAALFLAVSVMFSSLAEARAQMSAPTLGTPIPYVDADGVARGSITVTEIIDPFEQYNPDYPPEAGSRVVAVTVAFDADAGDRFEVTPWAVVLQDSDGFIWTQGSVLFAADMLIPELTSQTLAPGSRITGIVGFVLPDGAEPARVFYQPESSRLIALAELSDVTPPSLGDPVDLIDTNGGMGIVRVTEAIDPFAGFDPGYPPEPGTRFVALTLVYENSGGGRFDIEPYGLLLRDANGNLWYPASLFRPAESIVIPDLTGDQLAPGDRRSGLIGFAVPEGVGLEGLYLSPVSSQLLTLARFATAFAAAPQQSKPAAATPATEAAAAPTAVPTAVPAIGADDPCSALYLWLERTRERIAAANSLAAEALASSESTTLEAQAAAFAALADEQGAAPPAEAAAVNKAIVASFRAFGAAAEGGDLPASHGDVTARLADIEVEMDRIALECNLG